MSDVPIIGEKKDDLPVARQGELVEWPCPNCKQKAHFEIPQFEIVNVRTYSSVHFAHEHFQNCEHCQQPHMFVVTGVKGGRMIFGFQAIQVQGQSKIQVVPQGAIPDGALRRGGV